MTDKQKRRWFWVTDKAGKIYPTLYSAYSLQAVYAHLYRPEENYDVKELTWHDICAMFGKGNSFGKNVDNYADDYILVELLPVHFYIQVIG